MPILGHGAGASVSFFESASTISPSFKLCARSENKLQQVSVFLVICDFYQQTEDLVGAGSGVELGFALSEVSSGALRRYVGGKW